MLILGALIGIGLLSMIIPLKCFFAMEGIILDCILIIIDWIAEIIDNFFDIRLQLDKLLDAVSLKSAFLFLETYFFCEFYRANKMMNDKVKNFDSVM